MLASDFVATNKGSIQLEITNLSMGEYQFKSWHMDPITTSTLGFAQGATSKTPNKIEARVAGILKGSVTTTALGSSGLNTISIKDDQIPCLSFSVSHKGKSPLIIDLTSTLANGSNRYLLINGFELNWIRP